MMYDFYIDKDGRYFLMGNRNHQVSVRLPQVVYDVICVYDGNSFSEKLVNFVIDHSVGK